jgi:hypothetical protein
MYGIPGIDHHLAHPGLLKRVIAGSKTPLHYDLWINGKEVPSGSGKRFERRSPAHGTVVGNYAEASTEDVDTAVQVARQAFDRGPWPHSSGADRMKCLLKAAELIRQQKEELALIETLESGKPISQARDEMDWAAGLWDYAATLCRHIYGDSYNALGPSMLGQAASRSRIYHGRKKKINVHENVLWGGYFFLSALDKEIAHNELATHEQHPRTIYR